MDTIPRWMAGRRRALRPWSWGARDGRRRVMVIGGWKFGRLLVACDFPGLGDKTIEVGAVVFLEIMQASFNTS